MKSKERAPLTKAQRRAKILHAATSRATEKYNIGGRIKEGRYMPKPVTLPAVPWKDNTP